MTGDIARRVDDWFSIAERGSTVGREVRAGIATFLTMAYILLVNPQILSLAGLPLNEVASATALSACVASLLCGLFANLPLGVSPGLGLNGYLVYSQVLGQGVTPEAALACCFTAAVIVAVLALVRALSLILRMVPTAIKLATVLGMGLLLSFIALQNTAVVVPNERTMVSLGDFGSFEVLLAVVGLALMASLHHLAVKGAILLGMTAIALIYFAVTGRWPSAVASLPSLRFFRLDFSHLLAWEPSAWSAVLAYGLVMVFDIGGAVYGLASIAGLIKPTNRGQVPGSVATYLAASVGSMLGAATGTTPLIVAAESAVGIKDGGRTGLAAVVVAACFAACLFLAPLFREVPPVATSPVLVMVGALMISEAGHVNWSHIPSSVPAFLTMVIQPFTFSIANGIYAGLLFSLLIHILTGEAWPYVKDAAAAVLSRYPTPNPSASPSPGASNHTGTTGQGAGPVPPCPLPQLRQPLLSTAARAANQDLETAAGGAQVAPLSQPIAAPLHPHQGHGHAHGHHHHHHHGGTAGSPDPDQFRFDAYSPPRGSPVMASSAQSRGNTLG